jgi:hypothetical protein
MKMKNGRIAKVLIVTNLLISQTLVGDLYAARILHTNNRNGGAANNNQETGQEEVERQVEPLAGDLPAGQVDQNNEVDQYPAVAHKQPKNHPIPILPQKPDTQDEIQGSEDDAGDSVDTETTEDDSDGPWGDDRRLLERQCCANGDICKLRSSIRDLGGLVDSCRGGNVVTEDLRDVRDLWKELREIQPENEMAYNYLPDGCKGKLRLPGIVIFLQLLVGELEQQIEGKRDACPYMALVYALVELEVVLNDQRLPRAIRNEVLRVIKAVYEMAVMSSEYYNLVNEIPVPKNDELAGLYNEWLDAIDDYGADSSSREQEKAQGSLAEKEEEMPAVDGEQNEAEEAKEEAEPVDTDEK